MLGPSQNHFFRLTHHLSWKRWNIRIKLLCTSVTSAKCVLALLANTLTLTQHTNVLSPITWLHMQRFLTLCPRSKAHCPGLHTRDIRFVLGHYCTFSELEHKLWVSHGFHQYCWRNGLGWVCLSFKTGCEILFGFSSMACVCTFLEPDCDCLGRALVSLRGHVGHIKNRVTCFCGVTRLSLSEPFTTIVTCFLHRLEQL